MSYLKHSRFLARGEGSIANIRRIIHIIMNVIQARLIRATILTRRASARRHLLDRSVTDRVSSPGARLSLEDVEEAKPVARLVRSRAAEIIAGSASAWDRIGEDVTAVLLEGRA